jgi:hypothetical protein
MRWLRNLFKHHETLPPSEFYRTVAAILLRDAHRQEEESKIPPAPPPKLIGLRKILAELLD